MKLFIIVFVVLLFNSGISVEFPKLILIKANVYNYNGLIITDKVGDGNLINELRDAIYTLNKMGYLKLLYENNTTNIVLDYDNDDSIAWVMFDNGYFTDTIHLNSRYFYSDDYCWVVMMSSIIHECWHVILNVKFKNKNDQELREKICEKKGQEIINNYDND